MSPARIPRPLRLLLGGVGALVLLLAAGGGVLFWWVTHGGEAWLDREAEARIHAAIEKASVPGYHINLGSLKADARNGSLVVTDTDLNFEPQLLDSLRTGAFRYLFAAKVVRVELRGLSFWRLLLRGEIRVQAIVLEGPEFHYFTGPKRVDLADPFKRLGRKGKGLLSVLVADTLTVQHGSAAVQDLNKVLPELKVKGLDIAASAVRIAARGRNAGVHLSMDGAELNVNSIGALLPDGSRLHIGAVSLSRVRRSGRLTDIRIIPEKVDSTATDRLRKSELTLSVDSILLNGLDMDRSIAHEALFVNNIDIIGLRAGLELDKTLPLPERTLKELPTAALANMSFSIKVDTARLVNANILYRERDPSTGRWGEVPFNHLNARFHNITNDAVAIAASDSITGNITFVIFDSAQVECRYSAALDGSERFKLVARLSDLPLVELNQATRPLMRMEVKQGVLRHLAMDMNGNARRAKGTMALNFEDVVMQVEPGTPRELRHSLMGNTIDIMLLQEYGGGMSADRERNYSIGRDPERSIFNYVWHATREGLVRNLLPEAKERMRTVLRTDAETRKENRAVRRENK